jgi:lipoprotein NlpD
LSRTQISKIILLVALALSLTSCANHKKPARVIDVWGHAHKKPIDRRGMHAVKANETLYSIAWKYNWDYRDLARLNHISPPYKIMVGQWIKVQHASKTKKLRPHAKKVQKRVISKHVVSAPPKKLPLPAFASAERVKHWLWPVSGRVIQTFSNQRLSKGIDVAARLGVPVVATAAGKVVYSGSGLRGYGELIIIKHNEEFLSAYAHNQKLLVHEGQRVKAGQMIAEVGDTDAKRPMLHFEIRRAGKPVDPLQYLDARRNA